MQIELMAHGFDMGGELEKYTKKKLASLQRHVPRKVRDEATCKVAFSVVEFEGGKASTCNIVLRTGDATYNASESTEHMYAAFDIATARVRLRLLEDNKQARATRPRRRFRTQP